MTFTHVLDVDALPEGGMKTVRAGKYEVLLTKIDGAISAIGNTCVHKGGPLGKGRLKKMDEGCYVACPWHGYEYNIRTGEAPGGYEDRVAVFDVKTEDGKILIANEPSVRAKAAHHTSDTLSDLRELTFQTTGSSLNILGISTTNMNPGNERYSTSEGALETALKVASDNHGASTRLVRLRDEAFRACEGYYSIHERACTWPCSITESDPDDGLTEMYRSMILWADVVLLSTPIRWGNASSLYYRMAERLNCVQNQITLHNRILIQKKVAGFIITGGQDNIQQVAGQLSTFFSELGFTFPPFNFVGWSRGWVAEDMEQNVQQFKASSYLKRSIEELVGNCVTLSRQLKHEHPGTRGTPLPRIDESPTYKEEQ